MPALKSKLLSKTSAVLLEYPSQKSISCNIGLMVKDMGSLLFPDESRNEKLKLLLKETSSSLAIFIICIQGMVFNEYIGSSMP